MDEIKIAQNIKTSDNIVKNPEDYENPEALYDVLIKTILKYHPSTDISMVKKAYDLAKEVHKG
jgi:GTP pyrophosphokinase